MTGAFATLVPLFTWARSQAPEYFPARPRRGVDHAAIAAWLTATRNQALTSAQLHIELGTTAALNGDITAAVELKTAARRYLDLAKGIGDLRA